MYGEINKNPTSGVNLVEAYKRLMDYYYPQTNQQRVGASVFDGYFGGSNSNASTPFIGQFDEGYIPIVNAFSRTVQPNYLIKPQGGM